MRREKAVTCRDKDIKELLYPYAVGGLEPDARSRVDVHLDSCKDCRDELSLLRTLAAEVVPDPGDAFWQAVSNGVQRGLEHEEGRKHRAGFRRLQLIFGKPIMPRYVWPAAAAAAVLMAWLFLAPQSIKTVKTIPQPLEEYLYEYGDPATLLSPAALGGDELLNVAAWADSEFRLIEKEAADASPLSYNVDIYEDIEGLNAQEMKRLSGLIEKLKQGV